MTAPHSLAVIGDGIIGLSAAVALLLEGHRVDLYAADAPGAAWRAAAGMLAPGGELQGGEPELIRHAIEARALWESWHTRLLENGAEFAMRRTGALLVGPSHSDRETVALFSALGEPYGLHGVSVSRHDHEELFSLVSPRVERGLFYSSDAAVDPLQVVEALRDLATTKGIMWRTQAESVRRGVVRGAEGDVQYDRVVVATGLRQLPIEDMTVPTIRPVRGATIMLHEGPLVVGPTIRGYVEGRPFYVVPRGGGSFCVGASSEEEEHHLARAGEIRQLLDDVFAVCPGLRDARFADVRVGSRPAIKTNCPLNEISPDGRTLVLGGHYRHGVLFSPLAAQAAVQFAVS